MGRKQREGRTKTTRTTRRSELRGGYTTDKRVDVSKLRFPDTRPATSAEGTGKGTKSD